MRNSQKLCALVCFGVAACAAVGCDDSDEFNPGAAGSTPVAGSGGRAGGAGNAGEAPAAGNGGALAGGGGDETGGMAGEVETGGTAGSSGSAGTAGTAGNGGTAGKGGSGGTGGSTAGTGGIGGSAAGTGGTGGSTAGTGGLGGSTAGSGGVGGSTAGTGGTGGASGSAGSGGSGGSGGACPAPTNFIDLFDFPDATTLNTTSKNPSDGKGKWTQSMYGSNPMSIANDGTLAWDAVDGNPAPGALKATSPFAATAGSQKLGLVYAIAPFSAPTAVANLSGRLFTARVRLAASPHTNCGFVATPWSTSDTAATGESFDQKFGTPSPILVTGTWVTITMDLDTSTLVTRINQLGIDFVSTCVGVEVGAGDTVVEVDHATVGCK